MRMLIGALVLALLPTLAVAPSMAAVAPDATPAPLGAADCTVDPIDPDAYTAAIAAATPPPPLPGTPTGTPADDATVAGVTEAIKQSIACTNAGDLGRLLAVIDPSYAPIILGVPNDQVPAAVEAAAKTSAASGPATPLVDDLDNTSLVSNLISVTNVTQLPEDFFHGLVSAEVKISRPGIGTVTATVYFRKEGYHYIITQYVYTQQAATPAA